MQYSNSEILAAVLNRFLQPLVQQFTTHKMASMPFMQMIDNKVKSWGLVSPSWSLSSELSPFIEPVTRQALTPIIKNYLSSVPDDAIPAMAHSIVDKGLEQGGISIMEGRVQIEKSDLEELKKLLNYNMPLKDDDGYKIITDDPSNGTETTANSQQAV